MKLITFLGATALLCATSSAWSATAFFTGNMQQAQSVTGRSGWNCEYQYAGRKFWMFSAGTCPTSVNVQ